MTNTNEYKYLGPKLGSFYRQYFVKGTNSRAETVYREIIGAEQLTPEEVARNRNLPLEAVQECIDYCQKNADLLRQEWEEEEEDLARRRALDPIHYPVPPRV